MNIIDRKGYCIMNTKLLLLSGLIITGCVLDAAPLGFLEPYNFMIESEPLIPKRTWQWNFQTQTSVDTKSFNQDGTQVNAMQIYEPQQNVVGLYQGVENSQFMQLINSIAGGAGGGANNAQTGLFTPTGEFSGYQVAFLSSLRFHNNCYFKVSLPVYNLQLSNVTWQYTGAQNTFSGAQIEDELVSAFLTDAQDYFDLSLQGWKTSGLGDLALLLDYIADFPQGRTLLRNVRVHVRLGLTFPTGLLSDENVVLSQPLGADGSVTLPFGGGLDINLGRYLQTGFRAQFNYIWGNAKERRVPTLNTQTTLLYPTTAWTFKNYGITQTFDLYAQIYNPVGGLSFKVAYEYYFKPQDSVSVNLSARDYTTIQTDFTLDEVTRNSMILLLSFDSAYLEKFDKIHPQLGVYYNVPFNGSFATLASTVGVQLSLDW